MITCSSQATSTMDALNPWRRRGGPGGRGGTEKLHLSAAAARSGGDAPSNLAEQPGAAFQSHAASEK